ncbi:hypothetical protein [Actinomadura sp. 3N508]|uniref:hypothetical protein n=1 Tax=Actinomadura sp. 3N508 TaxID=3375153 RepID=UPI00378C33E7
MGIRRRIKEVDPVVLVALVVIVVGAYQLYGAIGRASPLVDFGTEEEARRAAEARPYVYAWSGVIGLGGVALLAVGRRYAALLVAPAAVLPAVLLASTSASMALPFFAAVVTIPLAVGAGVRALLTRRRTR